MEMAAVASGSRVTASHARVAGLPSLLPVPRPRAHLNTRPSCCPLVTKCSHIVSWPHTGRSGFLER